MHSPRLASIEQSAEYTGFIYIDLVCSISLLLDHTHFVSIESVMAALPNLLIELTVNEEVVCDGRPQVHKLMNDHQFCSC